MGCINCHSNEGAFDLSVPELEPEGGLHNLHLVCHNSSTVRTSSSSSTSKSGTAGTATRIPTYQK